MNTQISANSLLITIGEAATICGTKPTAIRSMIKSGLLQGRSFGAQQKRARYVTRASLENFINGKED